jgi:ribonuclease P protein component
VRVAYAVGRRLGGAVERNRWRRRLRAIAGEVCAALPAGAYLVVAGPGIGVLAFDELKKQVTDAMRRASERAG